MPQTADLMLTRPLFPFPPLQDEWGKQVGPRRLCRKGEDLMGGGGEGVKQRPMGKRVGVYQDSGRDRRNGMIEMPHFAPAEPGGPSLWCSPNFESSGREAFRPH